MISTSLNITQKETNISKEENLKKYYGAYKTSNLMKILYLCLALTFFTFIIIDKSSYKDYNLETWIVIIFFLSLGIFSLIMTYYCFRKNR